jgi:O-antigen/teichoic acid export membrane protein
MTKATKMAKVSVKGGFNVLWGLVLSTVISSVGSIFAIRLLGHSNYGLYYIALNAVSLISTFRDWGVATAMIKYTAQYRAEDRPTRIRSIFAGGILFETILGLVLAAVAFLFSGLLARLYSLPSITPLIEVASFVILTGALFSTAQATFTGFEKMELSSVTLVAQSSIKAIVVPSLVILGFGPLGAITGFTVASLIAGLIAFLFVWSLYKVLPKPTNGALEIRAAIRTMFDYGFPLSIASIISTFQAQFYIFILPIFVSTSLIGDYGAANLFVVLIGFFATPVSTMLFPAFSKLDPQKDHETLKNVFQFSIKYASLLVVPVAAVVMVLAKPGISILFPSYTAAPLFLSLLAINYLYVAFGSLSVSNLINSQGQTRFSLRLSLITFAIGFPMSIFLISRFGILGLIVTSLTAGLPSLTVALHWLKKRYDVTIDWKSSAKILLSGGAASLITYELITHFISRNLVALVVGAIVFLFVFLNAIILTGAITRSDIDTLREIMTVLGPLGGLANRFLTIIEKLMNALKSNRN